MNITISAKQLRVTAAAVIAAILFFIPCTAGADDVPEICVPLIGTNVNAQDYGPGYPYWAEPVYSYLTTVNNEEYMTVQGNVSGRGVMVCYYGLDFTLLSRKEITPELPIFGGFYETEDNYYLVTGQNNPDEDDSLEVIRMTKYDKDWERISSCGLFGCNTTVPFDAGSVRFARSGKYIAVRTSHEMYKYTDGINHQANLTFMVDADTMTVTQSDTAIANNSVGYVSHSFNQFIAVEDGKLIALDHGDASPRSICLFQYSDDFTRNGIFRSGYNVGNVTVLDIAGQTGANRTGASAGALEISQSSYLISGNTVRQEDGNSGYVTANAFVAAVNKNTHKVNINYLTRDDEGGEGSGTPHLVRISDNKYAVFCTIGESVFYTFVDGNGERILSENEYTLSGSLSDCKPIYQNGKIIWYTWDDGDVTFYSIPVSDPGNPEIITENYDHDLVFQGASNGLGTFRCSKCGYVENGKVPTSFTMYWRDAKSDDHDYWNAVPSGLTVSDTLLYMSEIGYNDAVESDNVYPDLTVTSSDPANCVVDEDNESITFNDAGSYRITVTAKYNPSVSQVYRIDVKKPLESAQITANGGQSLPYGVGITLNAYANGGLGTLQYRFSVTDEDGAETIIRDFSETSRATWQPGSIGVYSLRVDVKDTGDNDKTVSSEYLPFTIRKAPIRPKSPVTVSDLVYGQKLSEAVFGDVQFITVSGGRTVTGTVSINDPDVVLSAGTHTRTYTMVPDNENYETCSGTVQVKVVKAVPEIITAPDVLDITYHPERALSSYSLTGGAASCDGTFVFTQDDIIPKVPGDIYSCDFIPSDTANYETASTEVMVNVSKASPYTDEIDCGEATYGQSLSDVDISAQFRHDPNTEIPVPGTLAWKDGTIKPVVSDSLDTDFIVVFTPDDTDNYDIVEDEVCIIVNKAERPAVFPSGYYSVPYETAVLTNDILSGAPDWKFQESLIGSELKTGEENTFTAVYMGSDAGNYEIEAVEVLVTRSSCSHDGGMKTVGNFAPTCIKKGYTGDRICRICNEVVEEGTEIPEDPDNHVNIRTVMGIPATETEEGHTSYKVCDDCGRQVTEPEVLPPLGAFSLETKELYLMPGETGTIEVAKAPSGSNIEWSSSNPKIAEVSDTGVVTALKQGTALITAKAGTEDKSDECFVRVLFYDVDAKHNFRDHVYWAADSGITGGYTGDKAGYFGVGDPVQRGQVVMFLWRMAGKPEPSGTGKAFSDVPKSNNFYNAIMWASEQGIAGGYTGRNAGKFGPGDNCTRGQIATFLWRFAGKPAPSGTGKTFADVPEGHNFYTAVSWAAGEGIAGGYTGARAGSFGPGDECTRGQMVTFLHRYALKQ